MDKIKIGLLGASSVYTGIEIVQIFKNAELSCIYDINAQRLAEAVKYAREYGFYVKSINNSDDFYDGDLRAVFAAKNMYEYIRKETKTLLLDGECMADEAFDGLYMQKNGNLFFYEDKWTPVNCFKFSPEDRLELLKTNEEAAAVFFMHNFDRR